MSAFTDSQGALWCEWGHFGGIFFAPVILWGTIEYLKGLFPLRPSVFPTLTLEELNIDQDSYEYS